MTNATIAVPASLLEHPDRVILGQSLRETLGIRSPVTDYREDSDQIQMTFVAPGHRTVVTLNRAHRTGEVETKTRGLLGSSTICTRASTADARGTG
jgi:hypothetical protein